MTRAVYVLFTAALLVGCAPRQDPGVPVPPPGSGEEAIRRDEARTAGGIPAPSADTIPSR